MSDSPRQSLNLDLLSEHIALYESDPVAGHDFDTGRVGREGIAPTLLLTTTGRKSGQARSLPLIYQPVGDGFIIIGSLGGAPKHPQWYLNLVANPECEVQVGKFKYKAVAETGEGPLRERYWDLAARTWPAYADYQVAAGERQIPVVLLRATAVIGTG